MQNTSQSLVLSSKSCSLGFFRKEPNRLLFISPRILFSRNINSEKTEWITINIFTYFKDYGEENIKRFIVKRAENSPRNHILLQYFQGRLFLQNDSQTSLFPLCNQEKFLTVHQFVLFDWPKEFLSLEELTSTFGKEVYLHLKLLAFGWPFLYLWPRAAWNRSRHSCS